MAVWGRARVGCSGWQYKHWRGDFYPPDVPTTRWFEYYAARFDTVEINNTFYRLPEAETLSRWRAKAPAGTSVEWNAEIINEVADQVIGWRSIEGSDVVSAGSVNFEPSGAGTRVRVRLQYSPPGGKVGDAIARLVGSDAATQIREDLTRFKEMIESNQLA